MVETGASPGMRTAIEQAVGILREDGPASLARDAAAFLRREGSRRYAAATYEPEAPPCRVMAEDWDTLVVLDACRFDQFERLSELPGRLEARTSLGSCTPEFLDGNFCGATHYDTVYVTANPMYRATDVDDVFHDVVDVWESGWDETNQTVHPEEMADATLAAHERYPDKRILAHFVQPHYPFVGDRGREIERQTDEMSGIEWIERTADGDASKDDRATPWDLLDRDVLDEATVREAYDENLRLALPHVERVLDGIEGKAVVTSDHGNLVGERVSPFSGPVHGHPPDTRVAELLTVPWLVVAGENRREVRAEDPARAADEVAGDDVVAERLADLGYA